MARVLVLLDFFVPGHRAGGPIRSVARIVESEVGTHDVSVIARDHDLGDPKRFEVATEGWVSTLGARVHYADLRSWAGRRRALNHVHEVKPDLVYLNSLWAPAFTLAPLAWLRVTRRRSVVLLAPRGACGPEALALKSRKKSVVRALLRRWLRWGQLVWHSTSDQETADIAAWMGTVPARVVTRSSSGPNPRAEHSLTHAGDRVRVVGVSRISPVKDVLRYFQILSLLRSEVDAAYYGPLEDADYWESCQPYVEALPSNVNFEYRGELSPSDVPDMFASADVFLFPTRGENFGHVIAEALSVGCPVLTTPTTIWTDLLNRGGGSVFVDDAEAARHIDRIAADTLAERDATRERAWTLYREWSASSTTSTSLFDEALGLVRTGKRGA